MSLGYKRIILDYHFSDFLSQTLTQVDPEDYVRRMKAAGVEAYLVYAKDHWGNVYHHTTISHKHAYAPDDLFGALLKFCRQYGITPYAYTTLLWDEHSARTHPEWRARGADGLLIEAAPPAGAGWHHLCVNTPYRAFFLEQLEELAANYDFEALFIDILFYFASSFVCYCDDCRQKWRAMYGDDLPTQMSVPDRVRYAAFRDAFYREFYTEVRAILARHGKETCLITHNAGGTDPSLPDFIGKETEPFGQDYVIPQIVIKESRNRARGRGTEIYFGRFNRFWDFTVKSKELLRWEAVNAFAHDCAATIIDQPLLTGQLDPHAYESIGWAYREAGRVLAFTRGSQPYAEIAVYYDHLNYEATLFEGHDDFVGACKLLTECHLPFDLLTDFDPPEAFDRYAAIVLPYTPLVSSAMQAALRKYVERGGTLICDYRAGVWDEQGARPGSQHFMLDVPYAALRSVNFIVPTIKSGATYLRAGRMLDLTLEPGDDVLGQHVPGALEDNQWVWVSHNTPPGLPSGNPAVIVREVAQGRILYFGAALFAEYLQTNLKSLREFIGQCIARVYQPRIWVEAPSIVDAIYQQKGGRVIVTLNCCTLDRGANASSMIYGTLAPLHANLNESYPIGGMRVLSRGPLRRAEMLDGTVCDVTREGDTWVVALPAIDGYDAVALELA